MVLMVLSIMDAYAEATTSALLYCASLTFADDVFAKER